MRSGLGAIQSQSQGRVGHLRLNHSSRRQAAQSTLCLPRRAFACAVLERAVPVCCKAAMLYNKFATTESRVRKFLHARGQCAGHRPVHMHACMRVRCNDGHICPASTPGPSRAMACQYHIWNCCSLQSSNVLPGCCNGTDSESANTSAADRMELELEQVHKGNSRLSTRATAAGQTQGNSDVAWPVPKQEQMCRAPDIRCM